MKDMKRSSALLFSTLSLFGLAACGGGSSSPSEPKPPLVVADDTTPNTFSFNPITNALRATPHESETVTISGINAATSISIENGE